MKKIIISLLFVILSADCMEKAPDQINLATAQSLIASQPKITPENITQMLEAAKVANQDLSRDQLNQAARIIGFKQLQKSHNPNTLSEFVLNYSTEQNGKLRFRLLDFFLRENKKALQPHDKLYLGWNFLFKEAGQERKEAVMKRLIEIIYPENDSTLFISQNHDIDESIFESKKETEEYEAFSKVIDNYMLQKALTLNTQYHRRNASDKTILAAIYSIQSATAMCCGNTARADELKKRIFRL